MSDSLEHSKADQLCKDGLHAFEGGVCRDCGHVANPPAVQPRRGPVEALAMELRRRTLPNSTLWGFLDAEEQAIWIQIAEVVAARERKRGGVR